MFISNIIDTIVRVQFARIVYKINGRNLIVPLIICFFNCLSFVAGLVSTIRSSFQLRSILRFEDPEFKISLAICAAMGFLADVLTTVVMCKILDVPRNIFKWRRDSLLTSLFKKVLTRGIFLCMIEAAYIIFALRATGTFYWMAVHLCLSKIYVNTSLVLLNIRHSGSIVQQEVQSLSAFKATSPESLETSVEPQFSVSASGQGPPNTSAYAIKKLDSRIWNGAVEDLQVDPNQ